MQILVEKDTLGSMWHLHLGGRASVLRESAHLKRLPPFNYRSNQAVPAWRQLGGLRSERGAPQAQSSVFSFSCKSSWSILSALPYQRW